MVAGGRGRGCPGPCDRVQNQQGQDTGLIRAEGHSGQLGSICGQHTYGEAPLFWSPWPSGHEGSLLSLEMDTLSTLSAVAWPLPLLLMSPHHVLPPALYPSTSSRPMLPPYVPSQLHQHCTNTAHGGSLLVLAACCPSYCCPFQHHPPSHVHSFHLLATPFPSSRRLESAQDTQVTAVSPQSAEH